MIKKKFLSLLRVITVVFVISVLMSGCKLFFNNNQDSNNNVEPEKTEKEKTNKEETVFDIQINLNPQMLEHGAVPSDGNIIHPRSTNIIPNITTIESLSVTATRKKDVSGTDIASTDQTVAAGNIITATANTSQQNFFLKINKTGTWLIEVSFTMSSITYEGSETIKLTEEKPYKKDVPVYAYATGFTSLNASSTGNVNLVTEYAESLIAGSPSIVPQVAKMKLRKRNLSTGEDDGSSYIIDGIINSTARTVTFQREIPSGLYFAEIAFFADTEQKVPLYVCSETIIVADDKTTNAWVISSSFLERSSGEVLKYLENGPLQAIDNEVKFKITSGMVEAFAKKYEGLEYYVGGKNASDLNNGSKQYPFATVQKAVNTIIGTASEPGVNDKHSQYTILLKSDIKENQNTASYDNDRKYSYIYMTGLTSTPSDTQIKITSDSEALEAYNNSSSTPKETGHGFSIDANRDADHLGSVIYIEKVILTLEKVTIRGGYGGYNTNTINKYAGGIVLYANKTGLILNQGACIENNIFYGTTSGAGGVSLNSENTYLIMNGGEIRNNNCKNETNGVGGVYVYGFNRGASFTMYDGKIYGNTGGKAGGIYLGYHSTFTMKGGVIGKPSSEVNQTADEYHWGNKANNGGGAIYVDVRGKTDENPANNCYAEINLEGGEICYNYSKTNGGAIFCGCSSSNDNTEKAILNLNGTNLLYNAAGVTSDSGSGGAIYAQCTIINMYKGIVKGNQAGGRGGAFCVENTLAAGSGSDNDNRLYIHGGRITQNLCKNTGTGSSAGLKALGGGIYLGASAKCYVQGGIIEQNKTYATNASSSAVSYGGGIYTENMTDGTFVTYTPATDQRFAPHLYINGGLINDNSCGALSASSKKRGSGIFTDCTLYTINKKNVVAVNNSIEQASMVYVEGSTTSVDLRSTVGSNTLFNGTERTIDNFNICNHEVTQAEFNAVLGMQPSEFQDSPATGEKQEYRPVEKTNWYDAIIYCNKLSLLEGLEPYYTAIDIHGYDVTDWNSYILNPENSSNQDWNLSNVYTGDGNGYRLPTSLEWEYAARDGEEVHAYFYAGVSSEITPVSPDSAVWHSGNSGDDGGSTNPKTHEVMKKTPNDLGLYDMSGNVAEWCEDDSSGNKIKRGGSYSSDDNYIQLLQNAVSPKTSRSNNTGFRVVRNVPSSSTTQKYIVTFDTTTNWPGNTNTVSPQIITAGGTVTAPSLSDPTPIAAGEQKHGTFLGWYTKPIPQQNPASGSSTPIDSPFVFAGNTNATEVNSNITLYAVWDFVYVPGAVFEGKETLCNDDTTNTKKSQVFIQDRVLPIGNLWVCDHEVTQGEYSKYCKYSGTGPDSSWGRGNNYPAYYVSWYDALVYCNLRSKDEGLTPVYKIKKNGGAAGELTTDPARWVAIAYTGNGDTLRYGGPLSNNSDWNAVVCDWDANGYRLPTEAEWEYIARGGNGLSGTQYVYSGSDDIDKVAWNPVGNGKNITHEVRKKQANSLGLYDMSGNVWEWCWDLRNTLDSNTPAIGPDVSSQDTPERIRRGGSSKSSDTVNYCRVNYRTSSTHNLYIPNLGFRVVRNADGSAPYEPPKYTVTFDTTTNWSSNNLTVAPVQVYEGKTIARPSETPIDNTVNFRGWFTKPDPSTTGTAFDFDSTAIYRDLTLYAVWDFVYVPGAVFNSSTTLCAGQDAPDSDINARKESKVFIANRLVPIDSLYVCDHEVTQGEWEQYMTYMTNYGPVSTSTGPNYPLYNMNWYEAIMYCNLRSEAEDLTPVYYLVDENGNEVTNGRMVSTWKDSVLSGSNIKQNDSGKYYYDKSYSSNNNTKLDYEGKTDTDGGIRFDTNANGYRLPTLAEWEYLARGGNLTDSGQTIYSGSDTINNVAWNPDNSDNRPHIVKTKACNALGLYDMSGNLFEVSWDWFVDPIDVNTPITGPLTRTSHYGLGGSFDYARSVAKQEIAISEQRFSNRGLRVVRNASSHTCLVKFDTTTNWPGNTRRVSSQIIDAGDTAVAPATTNPAPTAADAMHGNFLGWYTKPKPSQNPANPNAVQITPIDSPFDFNTPITSDITLYAVWDFVYVEGGTVVGSDDYNPRRADGENYIGAFPAGRTVTLSSFYICDHELTQGEYETYCCYTSSTPSSDYGVGADYPAYNISWYDAIVYCNLRSIAEGLTPCYSLSNETDPKKWTGIKSSNGKYSCNHTSSNSTWNSITCNMAANGYRLPTEAEWEYAARGGQETYGNETSAFANYFAGATTTNYSASSNSDLDSVGWYLYNICNNGVTGSEGSSGAAGYGTHEVKKKAPNALGLYDMSGNVLEWCWDWKGSISTSETETDPRGASSGSYRLRRGGSWGDNASGCSVSIRGSDVPYGRYSGHGFRLVRSAQ